MSDTTVESGVEHDCPECPLCGHHRTRPLDDTVAVCFECDSEFEGDFADLRK